VESVLWESVSVRGVYPHLKYYKIREDFLSGFALSHCAFFFRTVSEFVKGDELVIISLDLSSSCLLFLALAVAVLSATRHKRSFNNMLSKIL